VFSQKERDANLLVVVAVEGYSMKHGIPASEVAQLFCKHGLFDAIRSNFEILHTQSLEESAAFADDILARIGA